MPIEKQPYLPGFEDPQHKHESQVESSETKLEKSNLETISNQVDKPKKITSVEIEKQANKFGNKALRMLKEGKASESFVGSYQIITYQDKDQTIKVKRKYKKYLVEVIISNSNGEIYILRYSGRGWIKIIGGLEPTLNDEEFEKLSKKKPEPKGPITFIDMSSKKFDD